MDTESGGSVKTSVDGLNKVDTRVTVNGSDAPVLFFVYCRLTQQRAVVFGAHHLYVSYKIKTFQSIICANCFTSKV